MVDQSDEFWWQTPVAQLCECGWFSWSEVACLWRFLLFIEVTQTQQEWQVSSTMGIPKWTLEDCNHARYRRGQELPWFREGAKSKATRLEQRAKPQDWSKEQRHKTGAKSKATWQERGLRWWCWWCWWSWWWIIGDVDGLRLMFDSCEAGED